MLLKLKGFLRKLLGVGKKGQTAMEYALIIGGVSLVIYVAMNTDFAAKFKENIGALGEKVVNGMLTGQATSERR